MNPKLLTLLFTIAATACTQMANACSGVKCDKAAPEPEVEDEAPKPAAKSKKAAKAAVEPEVEEETEDEDAPDFAALRKQAMKTVIKLFKADVANKKKVKAILDLLGEESLSETDDDNLVAFNKHLAKLG